MVDLARRQLGAEVGTEIRRRSGVAEHAGRQAAMPARERSQEVGGHSGVLRAEPCEKSIAVARHFAPW